MIKLCECGCGQPTKIIILTDKKQGRVKGEYNRFVNGHHNKGKNNNQYKDGKTLRKVYCRACGKSISYQSIYCKTCMQLGKRNHFYGKHHAEEKKEKMRGINSPSWQGGITPLHQAIRNLPEYNEWRDKIYQRDNYTCQNCGSQKSGTFNAHHSDKSFSELLAEFLQEYNQFSPFEDQHTLLRLAMKWQPFWTARGETLCKECHKLTENYLKKH